jgi:short-subunit dehydrogenase
MSELPYRTALIVGVGPGISASLARRLSKLGLAVALAARDTAKLDTLVKETSARAFAADAGDIESVAKLFESVDAAIGATASVKGYAQSAPFAMSKFALRALAQSAARELGPKGIHVAHFVVDGAVRSAERRDPADNPDSTLDPDAIAQTYIDVLRQPRSAWSLEVEIRPWVERF